jgi:hypothetical protein
MIKSTMPVTIMKRLFENYNIFKEIIPMDESYGKRGLKAVYNNDEFDFYRISKFTHTKRRRTGLTQRATTRVFYEIERDEV